MKRISNRDYIKIMADYSREVVPVAPSSTEKFVLELVNDMDLWHQRSMEYPDQSMVITMMLAGCRASLEQLIGKTHPGLIDVIVEASRNCHTSTLIGMDTWSYLMTIYNH